MLSSLKSRGLQFLIYWGLYLKKIQQRGKNNKALQKITNKVFKFPHLSYNRVTKTSFNKYQSPEKNQNLCNNYKRILISLSSNTSWQELPNKYESKEKDRIKKETTWLKRNSRSTRSERKKTKLVIKSSMLLRIFLLDYKYYLTICLLYSFNFIKFDL